MERICRGKCEKRQKKRISLLKRLTGVPWGSIPDVLTTKYKSYVRPVLDYGKLLAKASKSSGNKTNKIQNKAFRLLPLPLPLLPLKYRQILNPWGLGSKSNNSSNLKNETATPALNNGSAGSGFYDEKLFESSFAAGLGATNFDADIDAVRQVIRHLTNLATYYRQAVFVVDSQSTILTL
ncbi:hypothetical protein TNCV_3424851 [Trichonephila clavipes]|nr:hypothetical protein TNCV_3424851 [Trichonephila clavipes]